MSIVVTELPGRSGQWKLEKNFHRTYTHKFQVRTDNPFISPTTVNTAVLLYWAGATGTIQGIGHSYPLDPVALCNGCDCQQDPDTSKQGLVWTATITFDTLAPDPQQQNQDPTQNPPKISYGTRTIDFHVTKDLDNKDYINSAGDPFEQGLIVPKTVQTMTLEISQPNFDATAARQFQNVMNLDTWRGFSPRQVLLESVTAAQDHQNGMSFYRVTYNLAICPDCIDGETWDKFVLDCGYNFLDGSGNRRRIVDAQGTPVSSPRPLNGSGRQAPVTGPYFYRTFRVYRTTNFTTLFGA